MGNRRCSNCKEFGCQKNKTTCPKYHIYLRDMQRKEDAEKRESQQQQENQQQDHQRQENRGQGQQTGRDSQSGGLRISNINYRSNTPNTEQQQAQAQPQSTTHNN